MPAYIGVDLGSETLAACCLRSSQRVVDTEPVMINLQRDARALLQAEQLSGNPILLLEDDGNPSKRLRNRFVLRDSRVSRELPPDHAKLDFPLSYGDTLFQMFFPEGREPLLFKTVLPNLKVLFHLGLREATPEIEAKDKTRFRPEPLDLVQHLVALVIRNLVLKAPELEGHPDRHIAVTIPNVFSLSHASAIGRFIQDHTSAQSVSWVYESDALAYYALSVGTGVDARFAQEIRGKPAIKLITIDVGRGTTDLSAIHFQQPLAQDQPYRHRVLARTGRAEGGNWLSHRLALFYNDRVKRACHDMQVDTQYLPLCDMCVAPSTGLQDEQRLAVAGLERLVEAVKRNLDEEYRLTLNETKERELATCVAKLLVSLVRRDDDQAAVDAFVNALTLPRIAEPDVAKQPAERAPVLGAWPFQRRPPQIRLSMTRRLPDDVIRDIRGYIKRNVDDLLDDLVASMDAAGLRVNDFDTFVLIAGQGAGFRPLSSALYRKLLTLGLPLANVCRLTGTSAKEACCKGAALSLTAAFERLGQDDIYGTYGFLPMTATDRSNPTPVPTAELNGPSCCCEVSCFGRAARWFVYTPRRWAPNGRPPDFRDGMTAPICLLGGDQASHKYGVRYDRKGCCLYVNDLRMDLATFGDIPDDIWPRVWPELLARPPA